MNDLLGSGLRILLACWDVVRKRSKCLVYKLEHIMYFEYENKAFNTKTRNLKIEIFPSRKY